MGHISKDRIILVVICLVFTSILVCWQPDSKVAKKKLNLGETISNIKEWRSKGLVELDRGIVKSLEFDDYVNHNFSKGRETISLYIGYYLISKKIGAAHSPLVCFPGQGWVLSDSENKSLKIGDEKINFKKMVASIGSRKELLIYWFQAYDRTSRGTFSQKLNTLWSKYYVGREDNAFVRITVPIDGIEAEKAYETAKNFIELFYPKFLGYVKENNI